MSSNDRKLSAIIAPSFYELHKQIKKGGVTEVWTKGGRGSTKSSFNSVEILLGLSRDKNAHGFVSRRYDNELRDSVYGQMQWAVDKLGLNSVWRFMVSPMQAVNNITGQKIIFRGMDKPLKSKSINLGFGYIKYFWAEECDQYAGMEEIRNIIQSLFRGQGTGQIAFFSYNPPKSARSWVNAETKIDKPGRVVHHSVYTDVPPEWLGERFIAEAEHLKTVNEPAFRHEYMGEEIGTGLEVFNNVTLRTITDDEIQSFSQIRQGLDFGYAVDPVCFLRMNIDRKKRALHIFREVSGIGIGNRALAARLTDQEKRELTMADSAEPKSIAELRDEHRMNVRGASKPSGSVEHGIKWLTELEQIVIDPVRCPLAAKEFINYALEMNRNGDIISRYPDKDNHCVTYDTLVETAQGEKAIIDIKVGDYVITRHGYRECYQVLDRGLNQIYYLITKHGRILKVTKEHKIFTDDGYKSLDTMRYGSILYVLSEVKEWQAKNLYTMAIYSEDGQLLNRELTEYISSVTRYTKDCTCIFGKNITDLFPKAIVFIIRTAIQIIMILRILSALVYIIIRHCMSILKSLFKAAANGWIKLGRKQKSGMPHKKGGNGINDTAKKCSVNQEKQLQESVYFVGLNILSKLFRKNKANFVQINANQHIDGNKDLTTKKEYVSGVGKHTTQTNIANKNIVQDSVLLIVKGGIDHVYDINVKEDHEFFANGILVHNCIDAVRYSCVDDISTVSIPTADIRTLARI
jgi:PBSX family phage terminase large subunit